MDLPGGEHVMPAYLALNPNGVGPTLVHDETPIIESTVICEYLDELCPHEPHLSPSGILARARMRAWLRYIDEVPSMAIRVPTFQKIHLPRFQRMTEEEFYAFVDRNPLRKPFLRRMGRSGFSTEDYDTAIEQLDQSLGHMEEALNDGLWLIDDRYSIVDICIAPVLQRMEDLGMAEMWAASRLRVSDWYERIKACSAYRAAFYPGSLLGV
ncbi:MAG: glutathione S-transferase family protein [Rhodospirillales bacterium]|nr:glutathione S-transferase family protein [Rhodospirillales bacterium]